MSRQGFYQGHTDAFSLDFWAITPVGTFYGPVEVTFQAALFSSPSYYLRLGTIANPAIPESSVLLAHGGTVTFAFGGETTVHAVVCDSAGDTQFASTNDYLYIRIHSA